MKRLLSLVSLFAATTLAADDHIEVGVRPLSQPAEEQLQRIRKEESQPFGGFALKEESRCEYCDDNPYPPLYFPSSCHWMTALSALADTMETEDGTVWRVNSYDGYKILNWKTDDPLLLTQNTEWFSPYNYRLVNKNTGSSVTVNLFQGPILGTEFNRRIAGIDFEYGDLILTDGTRWKVSTRDYYLMLEWAFDDSIIVGFNSGWDSVYESILINVQMNKFIRARQY